MTGDPKASTIIKNIATGAWAGKHTSRVAINWYVLNVWHIFSSLRPQNFSNFFVHSYSLFLHQTTVCLSFVIVVSMFLALEIGFVGMF